MSESLYETAGEVPGEVDTVSQGRVSAGRLTVRGPKASLQSAPFYFALVALVAVLCVAKPKCNFDGVFYNGLASGSSDPQVEQRAGFAWLDHETSVGSPYEYRLRRDTDYFRQQLPFYSVKPLYVVLLEAVSKAGAGWRAGGLISGISFFLLAFVVRSWLSAYYSSVSSSVYALCLMLNPTMLQIARWTSPDVLSVMLSVTALWCILELKRPRYGVVLFLFAIWLRPDSIVFSSLVFASMLVTKVLPAIQVLAAEAVALGSYFFIAHKGYPISTLFYVSLISRENPPAMIHFALTPRVEAQYIVKGVQVLGLQDVALCVPVLLVLAVILTRRDRSRCSVLCAGAGLASFAIVYGIFPHFEARYFLTVLVYTPVLICLCAKNPLGSARLDAGLECAGGA